MNVNEFFQTMGQYAYIVISAMGKGIAAGWKAFIAWLASLPWPTAMKLFGNPTVNKVLFFGIAAYLLFMNIYALVLFGADKAQAKRKQRRVRESRLMKVCFWGGAIGGMIGMNVFKHKTLKKKFSIGIPILFVLQLILNSFILGFIGFWTFF